MGTQLDLTARQRRILEFINTATHERGYPPTVREIGEAVGLTSSSSVHSQLENLERKGYLHKDPTKPRAIATGEAGIDRGVAVPLVGRIAAGAPTLADQQVESMLSVPSEFTGRTGEHFALRVSGDSMTGAGIDDGDVVLVRRQDDCDDGDIVAAIQPGPAEDEATVKRLRRRNGRVVLEPENPRLQPFELGEGGYVAGRVVAVLHRL
ncbi:MAG TPA: transcriptional repressor LexA [Actinomycetota bacterium]|nr:transcriptional repressor LexA [Actinomycetota bacterium]